MLQSTKNFKVGDSVVFVGDEKSLFATNLANNIGGLLLETGDKKYIEVEYDKVGIITEIDEKTGVCEIKFKDGYSAVALIDIDIVENKQEEKPKEKQEEKVDDKYDFNININLKASNQKGVITDLRTGIKHEFENEDLNCFTENLKEKLKEVITISLVDRVFDNIKDLLGDEND